MVIGVNDEVGDDGCRHCSGVFRLLEVELFSLELRHFSGKRLVCQERDCPLRRSRCRSVTRFRGVERVSGDVDRLGGRGVKVFAAKWRTRRWDRRCLELEVVSGPSRVRDQRRSGRRNSERRGSVQLGLTTGPPALDHPRARSTGPEIRAESGRLQNQDVDRFRKRFFIVKRRLSFDVERRSSLESVGAHREGKKSCKLPLKSSASESSLNDSGGSVCDLAASVFGFEHRRNVFKIVVDVVVGTTFVDGGIQGFTVDDVERICSLVKALWLLLLLLLSNLRLLVLILERVHSLVMGTLVKLIEIHFS
jgi:hypothetical protein